MGTKFLALTVTAKLAVLFVLVILFHSYIGRVAYKLLTTPLADAPFSSSDSVRYHLSLVSCIVFLDLSTNICQNFLSRVAFYFLSKDRILLMLYIRIERQFSASVHLKHSRNNIGLFCKK